MQRQPTKSWSELSSLDSWQEGPVQLVGLGTAGTASKPEAVRAITVVLESSLAPRQFGIVAISDPKTNDTYVMNGGQFYVSTPSSIIASWLVVGTLNFSTPYLKLPASAGGVPAAIARFCREFTPERVAEESQRYDSIRLSAVAPRDFFERGSQLVAAELVSLQAENGTLRIELRSHAGTLGEFWIDVERRAVLKSTFDGREYR